MNTRYAHQVVALGTFAHSWQCHCKVLASADVALVVTHQDGQLGSTCGSHCASGACKQQTHDGETPGLHDDGGGELGA